MRILHVLNAMVPGGAEIFVKNLAIEQARCGNNVSILAMYEGKNIEFQNRFLEECAKNNVEIIRLNKKNNNDKVKTMLAVRRIVRKCAPDIINTHFERLAYTIGISLIGLKCCLITTVHNVVVPEREIKKVNFFIKYKIINSAIAICKQSEIAINNLGLDKVVTITNGININDIYRNRKINTNIQKVVCVGRLELQKNHKFLIESYKEVTRKLIRENLPIPTLEIYGEGSLKNELYSFIIENELENIVILKGHCENILEVLYEGDIYIMPSLYEGLSISLIEAMVTGIPIIATDVGGNSEVVINNLNGILIESNNSQQLIEAIIEMIKNVSLRQKMSEASKELISSFDIINVAQNYLDYYRQAGKINE